MEGRRQEPAALFHCGWRRLVPYNRCSLMAPRTRRALVAAAFVVLAGVQPAAAGSAPPPGWSDAAWSAWDGSGQATSVPAVVADPAAQQLTFFVRGTDEAIWRRTYASGAWGGWVSLGGGSASAPAAASAAGGQVTVFMRGLDAQLWTGTVNGATWTGWQPLGGVITSAPAAASPQAGQIAVFVRGTDRQLWERTWDGSAWRPWQALGGILTSDPAVTSAATGQLQVFVRGTDNQLWERAWNGTAWLPWTGLGGILTSAAAAASGGDGRIDVFVRGTDQALWQRTWDGSQWQPWSSLAGGWSSGPSADSTGPGTFDVFVRGEDSQLWHHSSQIGGWGRLGMVPGSNTMADVTYYKQAYPLSCEEASLQMAATHEGIFTSQSTVLNLIGIDYRSGYYDYNGVIHWGDPYVRFVGSPSGSEPALTGYGTYNPTIAGAAGRLGVQVDQSAQGVAMSTVYSAVLQNHPVIAWISADWRYHGTQPWIAFDGRHVLYAGPEEHSVLVVGVNATSVYVYNPMSGPQWVSKSTFASAFASYDDMAVIID